MIVDFHGALLQEVTYPGETITATQIHLQALRKRRTDRHHNWLAELRTEGYKEMYNKPRYPVNLFLNKLPTDPGERSKVIPVERLFEERIYIPPAKSGH